MLHEAAMQSINGRGYYLNVKVRGVSFIITRGATKKWGVVDSTPLLMDGVIDSTPPSDNRLGGIIDSQSTSYHMLVTKPPGENDTP